MESVRGAIDMRLVQALRRWKAPAVVPSGPPAIGDAYGGGYFVGKAVMNGLLYNLVTADITAVVTSTGDQLSATNSLYDGYANTYTGQGFGAAGTYCKNYRGGGFADWYVWSQMEADICYRNTKPSTATNGTSVQETSVNRYAVPSAIAFTTTNPIQTTAAVFKTGGAQAFDAGGRFTYRTSYCASGGNPWFKFFTGGQDSVYDQSYNPWPVRPMRKVLIPEPAIGAAFGGGFYYGRIWENGNLYWLVMADKSAEVTIMVKTDASTDPGSLSIFDGLANTNATNNASHPAAQYCKAYVDALGNNDYFLAAMEEWEPAYRILKPTTSSNVTASDVSAAAGINTHAVPTTGGYSASSPPVTAISAFVAGGAQAFQAAYYFTSTEGTYAGVQYQQVQSMSDGSQTYSNKNVARLVRPIRKVLVNA